VAETDFWEWQITDLEDRSKNSLNINDAICILFQYLLILWKNHFSSEEQGKTLSHVCEVIFQNSTLLFLPVLFLYIFKMCNIYLSHPNIGQ
jgi:hypothetical protein